MHSAAIALIVAVLSGTVHAQDFDKAKQEGRIVFYTSWGPSDADYVVKAFERKYPPLRVEPVRASSERTLNRLLSEQRAGNISRRRRGSQRHPVGHLERKIGPRPLSIREKQRIFPPIGAIRMAYGVGLHQTIYVIGYNSRLVSARRRAEKL